MTTAYTQTNQNTTRSNHRAVVSRSGGALGNNTDIASQRSISSRIPFGLSSRTQRKPNPTAYRYELLGGAKKIIGEDESTHRLLYCSTKPAENKSHARIVAQGDKVHLTDIHVCENPWICPVCSARIGQQRAAEIKGIMSRLRDHVVVMVTYTARHDRNMHLAEFADKFKEAIRKMKSGRAWQAVKKTHNIAHSIKSEEVTHGGNGWHYHAHELLFLAWDGQESYDVSDIQSAIESRWLHVLQGVGLSALGKIGANVTIAKDKIGEYLNKVGDVLPEGKDIASELARHDTKRGFENRSIMQLLHDASFNDDLEARFRWLEFVAWCKGKNRVTFSSSLKEIREELSTAAESSEAAEPVTLIELDRDELSLLWRARALPALIKTAQLLNPQYCLDFMNDLKKRWGYTTINLSLLD